ncbi:MAG TPA: hypothetical protein VNF27_04520 [Candidatus Binataceae bacterium]|nr:hypothetical protein [Candidatus Binataceae bacterium]
MKLERNRKFRATPWIALALFIAILTGASGCTAMYPQTAAQNYAPMYYEGGYNSLSAQQKMHLEDHLSNQSNQAWRTTAQVAGGLGHLMQGSGALLAAIRAHPVRRRL